MFNVNDKIFTRRIAISEDEYEELEEWSRCSSCGESNKKLKNCHFCGQLTCPTDLNHMRHYPVDNPSRTRVSNQVCMTCNCKFLYRDAMYELMSRLELRDEEMNMYQIEYQQEEQMYDNLVTKLTKQKTERAKLNQIIAVDREEMLRIKDDCDNDLLTAKK